MSSARLRNWSSVCTDLAGTPEEQLLQIRLTAVYAGASSDAHFFLLDGSKTYVAFDKVSAIPPQGQLYVITIDEGAPPPCETAALPAEYLAEIRAALVDLRVFVCTAWARLVAGKTVSHRHHDASTSQTNAAGSHRRGPFATIEMVSC
ncbi:hypothetical protein COCOBI_01-5110 [Coccomyxa sp. Obi]|nr:hypothetical protein COCOBI_01-5110 [Coccomyxa sp. Obi]